MANPYHLTKKRGALKGVRISFLRDASLTDTDSHYLKNARKVCYMGHRRWLDNDHKFRQDDKNFDGTNDFRLAPVTPSGLDIMMQTEKLVGRCLGKKHQALYNKRKRGVKMCMFGRKWGGEVAS